MDPALHLEHSYLTAPSYSRISHRCVVARARERASHVQSYQFQIQILAVLLIEVLKQLLQHHHPPISDQGEMVISHRGFPDYELRIP